MESSKVKCNICGNEYSVRGLTRHIKSCKKIKEKYKKGYNKVYTLRIRGKYNKDFFMYLNVYGNTTFGKLDQFLRDIWLECCDHLSCFYHNGEEISINHYEDFEDFGFNRGMDGTNIKLSQILNEGDSLQHIYDYGSTTKLDIDIIDEFNSERKDYLIEILARNKMPEYLKKRGFDANSPRAGVCGYDGPLDEFEDIAIWGENEKFNTLKDIKDIKEFKKLFEITNGFIKEKPFEFIPSDIVFIVEDADTKVNYYCNVLGYDNLEYGFNVHVGNYGLDSFIELINNNNSEDIFQNLNFFTLMFDEIDLLIDTDIENLERYNPNTLYDMYPFFKKSLRGEGYKDLNKDEAKKMTMVLEKFIDLAKAFRNEFDLVLDAKNHGRMIKTFYEDGKWKKVAIKPHANFKSVKYNKLDIKRIIKNNKKSPNKWELTSIFTANLTENEYFLEMVVLIDKNTGEILNQYQLEGFKDSCEKAKELIEETINKTKVIPMEISTDKLFYHDSLMDFLKDLNIKVSYEDLSDFLLDYKSKIHEVNQENVMNQVLNNLSENEIEELIQAEMSGEEIDEEKMMEIISKLDLF